MEGKINKMNVKWTEPNPINPEDRVGVIGLGAWIRTYSLLKQDAPLMPHSRVDEYLVTALS